MEDEFACAGMLRGSLTSLHDTVERIFGVTFVIGDDNLPDVNNGQIWLKLRGPPKNVKAAKVSRRFLTLVHTVSSDRLISMLKDAFPAAPTIKVRTSCFLSGRQKSS